MDKGITITNDRGLKYFGRMDNFIHNKLLNVLSSFEQEVIGNILAKFFSDSIDKHGADAVLSYMGDTFRGEHQMQNHDVINSLLAITASLITDYLNKSGDMKLIEDGANGLLSLLMGFMSSPSAPAAPAATAATPPAAA